MLRSDCSVEVFRDNATAVGTFKKGTEGPPFHAWLEPSDAISAHPSVAFCGIGSPERFFSLLEQKGFDLAGRYAFPDHHKYASAELELLKKAAAKAQAPLITTAKDYVRLPPATREGIEVLKVFMRTDDPVRFANLVKDAIERFKRERLPA